MPVKAHQKERKFAPKFRILFAKKDTSLKKCTIASCDGNKITPGSKRVPGTRWALIPATRSKMATLSLRVSSRTWGCGRVAVFGRSFETRRERRLKDIVLENIQR